MGRHRARIIAVMNIAILACADDASDHADHYPNDGEKFVALLGPLRPDWTFHSVPVHEDVLPGLVSDHDAYIVTGSSHSNTSEHAAERLWVGRLHAFLRRVDEARVPVVGICFGHQALAAALGGAVEKLPGASVAERTHVGTATMRMVAREAWMEPWRESLTLYCAHEEQVTRLPERARLLATHPRCPVAAFAVDDHIVACEFHPELYEDYLVSKLREMADDLGRDAAGAIEAQARAARDARPASRPLACRLRGRRPRRALAPCGPAGRLSPGRPLETRPAA